MPTRRFHLPRPTATLLSWLMPGAAAAAVAVHWLPGFEDTLRAALIGATLLGCAPPIRASFRRTRIVLRAVRQAHQREAAELQAQAEALARQRAHTRFEAEHGQLTHRAQAMNQGQLGFWEVAPQQQTLTVHGQFDGPLGFKPVVHHYDEAHWVDPHHPEDAPAVLQAIHHIMAGQTQRFEMEYRMSDMAGGWRWVLSRGAVLAQDAKGLPTRIAGAYVDITDRKRLEQTMQRERALFDMGPVLLFKYALSGNRRFISMSSNAARILRHRDPNWRAAGQTTDAMFHPLDLPELRSRVRQIYRVNAPEFSMEVRLRTGDAQWRWFRLQGVISSENDAPILRGYMLDVHELKEVQAQREQENRALSELVQSLNEAKHINALLQYTNDLLNSASTLQEACGIVQRSAQQMFPLWDGALSSASRHHLTLIGQWGEPPALAPDYQVRDCWALRRGKSHAFLGDQQQPLCAHIVPPEGQAIGPYLCVPMVTDGDTVGVLHLFTQEAQSPQAWQKAEALAIRFAETLKSAMANLQLRHATQEVSTRDIATGLHNRSHWDRSIDFELARDQGQARVSTVMLWRVDPPQLPNPAKEQEAIDAQLRSVALWLMQALPDARLLCRISRKRIALLWSGHDSAAVAALVAQALVAVPAIRVPLDGQILPTTRLRCGHASGMAASASTLMRQASIGLVPTES